MKSKSSLSDKILVVILAILVVVTATIYFWPTKENNGNEEIKEIFVENISLNNNSLSLFEGEKYQLITTVFPSNANDKKINYYSNNGSIALVDNDGLVTAIKEGKTTIVAKSKNGKLAECEVTVKKVNVLPTEITLSSTSMTLIESEKSLLTAKIKPSNASSKEVIWTSSDTSVVSVKDGKITALKEGKALITAKTINGKTAVCEITVKKEVLPSEITLSNGNITLVQGEKATITAQIKPSNATSKEITWTSSDTSIASVTDGKISALKAGTTLITARTKNGKIANCIVTVLKPTLTLNTTSVSIEEGKEVTLKATVSPSNSKVTWKSSNTSVATVTEGKVVGKKEGTAIITATSNGLTAECTVTVRVGDPILDVGGTLIAQYDSATLKYVISKTSTYAVTRVWVKDPYNQLKIALTKPKSSSAPVPRVPDYPANIINNEITNKKYTNKGLVAVNASSVVSDQFGTNLPSDWYGTASTPIVVYEGKVLRNSLDGENPAALSKKIYALTSSGYLTYYSYTNGSTAEKIASNQKIYNKIISDGVRYTWGFYPVLVKNGKFDTNVLNNYTDDFRGKNLRNSI